MSHVPASQREDGDFNIMHTLKKNTEAKLQAQTQAQEAEAKAAALEKEKLENEATMQKWMDAMAAKGIGVSTLPPLPGMGQSNITISSTLQVKFSNVPAGGTSGYETAKTSFDQYTKGMTPLAKPSKS